MPTFPLASVVSTPLCLALFSLLLFLSSLTPSSLVSAASYTIDSSPGLGHRFDGVGGLSAGASSRFLIDYAEPYRTQILDYLFTPQFGAALHILKVEIGGDAQSTEGTESSHQHNATDHNYQRGYEWWLMREAKRRNPNIKLYALSWGFPRWVAEGGSSPLTNSTALYTANWLLGAQREHGLTVDWVGIWNERPYSLDYIVALRRHLDQANLTTQIVAADDCCGSEWQICDDLTTHPTLLSSIIAIGGHYPQQTTTAACAALPLPKWSSEDFSSYYTAGGCWARLLNRNYVDGNLTATISWSPIAAYYDALPYSGDGLMRASSPWSGHFDVDQAIWISAHTTHFTTPGWHYLQHGSGVGQLSQGGTYVSLTNGDDLSIIVEAISHDLTQCVNEGAPPGTASTQNITFQFRGQWANLASLYAFSSHLDPTQPIRLFQYEGPVKVVGGVLSFTIDVNSVWTFSTLNTTKGSHPTPPPANPFPFPYHDSFDDTPLYSEPRYFMQQSGAFEVVGSDKGRVVQQQVTSAPVVWCGEAAMPYTIVGEYGWSAVNVSVDIRVEVEGWAMIAAGVTSGGCVGEGGSPGVVFGVRDGEWVVSNSTTLKARIAQGKVTVKAGQWYRLGLVVSGDRTVVSMDGVVVGDVAMGMKGLKGWVAMGSSFDRVQFDELRIEQVDGELSTRVKSVSMD